jgi:RNA polymerase sigma-70 factor (ECF subfamily)
VARAHARSVELTRTPDGDPGDGGDRDPVPPSPEQTEREVAAHTAALSQDGRRAVGQLAAAERDAILLTYFGGRSQSHTARLLGTIDGTLRTHIRSGMLTLRRALEVEGVTK